MVEVEFREDSRTRLSSFVARGHAGWAASGDDIVCAAVSTVLQTAWIGLVEVVRIDVSVHRDDAVFELVWPAERRDDPAVRAIVTTAAVAIDRLALQFPQHVASRRVHERRDRADHEREGERP